MNKRIFWFVATAALATSVAVWWLGPQAQGFSSKKSSSARARASLGEDHQEEGLSASERGMRAAGGNERYRTALGAVGKSPPTAPSAAAAIEPATEASGSTRGDAEEGIGATAEEMLANLDATFEMEPADRSWSARTVSDIYDVVQPVLGRNSEIRSVECKTSLCRIESVQEDPDHYASFVTKLKRSKVSPEGFYTQTGATPDGRPILTMYLARQGHPMPRLN
jgi:hypothetical protein